MTPNKKQQVAKHLDQHFNKLNLQVETLKIMLNNLQAVKHYKNIDKRFISKIMEGTPKDEHGHDQFYLSRRQEYYNIHDLTLTGRLEYKIERHPNGYEKTNEPEKIQYNTHFLDIGFTLYLTGDNGLFYSPEDDQTTRLEKTLVGVIGEKTKELDDVKQVIANFDDQIQKAKEYGELLNKADGIKNDISYYIKNSIYLALGQTALDLFVKNTVANDLER